MKGVVALALLWILWNQVYTDGKLSRPWRHEEIFESKDGCVGALPDRIEKKRRDVSRFSEELGWGWRVTVAENKLVLKTPNFVRVIEHLCLPSGIDPRRYIG